LFVAEYCRVVYKMAAEIAEKFVATISLKAEEEPEEVPYFFLLIVTISAVL
jgi:hypothetical protein